MARRAGLVPDGMICTGESYKAVVKLTFAKGAKLADPRSCSIRASRATFARAIDLHEGEKLDETAFKALIGEAVALNAASAR